MNNPNRKSLQQLTDAELVNAYRNGNGHAFEMLVSRHQPGMTRYITSIAGQYLADDVMQDVWEAVIIAVRKDSYKEEQCFCKWIKSIACRQAIKAWKDERRFNAGAEHICDSPDEGPSKEQELICRENEIVLHKLMSRLCEREKKVVTLHDFEQMSFGRIGRHLGALQSDAVRQIYCRAVKKMRQVRNG